MPGKKLVGGSIAIFSRPLSLLYYAAFKNVVLSAIMQQNASTILIACLLFLLLAEFLDAQVLAPSRDSVMFSCVLVGESPTRVVRIENRSGRDLNGVQVVFPGNPFKLNGVPTGPFQVKTGSSFFITVQFIPGRIGTWRDSIGIIGGGERKVIRLLGTASNDPALQAFPTRIPLQFGNVAVGDTVYDTLAYGSSGCRDLIVTDGELIGSSDYRLLAPTSYPDSVDTSRHQMIVAFSPSRIGRSSATYLAHTQYRRGSATTSTVDTTIFFTGEGILRGLRCRPDSIWFDSVSVFTSSPERTVVISNPDVVDLTINSIALDGSGKGAFAVRFPSTPFVLRARATGGSDAIDSTEILSEFTPLVPGILSARILISTSTGEYAISLEGVGVSPPTVELTPHRISFGPIMVGGTSLLVDTVRVINAKGSGAIRFDSIVIGGPDRDRFAITPHSGTVDGGDTAWLAVSFTPSRLGMAIARAFVFLSTGERLPLDLEGDGAPPGVFVAPRRVNFGPVPVSTLSSPRIVELVNLGGTDEQIDSVSLAGNDPDQFEFLSRSFPLRLRTGGGDTARMPVRFAPAPVAGPRSATLRIHIGSRVELVDLRGMAVVIGPSLQPASISFGRIPVGASRSMNDTLKLLNPSVGSLPFEIDSVRLEGGDVAEFSISGPTGVTVTAGESAKYTLTFTPGAQRAFRTRAMVYLSNNLTVPALLSGEGIQPAVDASPAEITFSPRAIGTVSPEEGVTVRNLSDIVRAVDSVRIVGEGMGDYAISRQNGLTIGPAGPSETWNAWLTFTPSRTGNRAATLEIYLDAAEKVSIILRGTGLLEGVTVQPGSIDFGLVHVDSTRTISAAFVLVNRGAAPITIVESSTRGNDSTSFLVENAGGGGVVPINGSAAFNASFSPLEGRAYASTVVLELAGGDEIEVPLSGTGFAPGQVALRLDTVYTTVGVDRPLRAMFDDPVSPSENLTGFRAALHLPRASIRILSSTPSGVTAQWTDGDTLVVSGAFAGPFQGRELFRLQFEGLITGRAENPVTVTDFTMSGTDLEATTSGGLIVLSGCDIARPAQFGRPARASSITPNPISGTAILRYTAPNGGAPWIRIVNVMGDEAKSIDLPRGTGEEQSATIDTGDLVAGFYFIELRLGTQRSSLPIVIAR